MKPRLRHTLLPVVSLWITACSLVMSAEEDQCATDADCLGRGSSFAGAVCQDKVCVEPGRGRTGEGGAGSSADGAGDAIVSRDGAFECIGNHPFPSPASPTVKLDLRFIDTFTRKPATSVKVSVCKNLTDPNCTSPALVVRPDPQGYV